MVFRLHLRGEGSPAIDPLLLFLAGGAFSAEQFLGVVDGAAAVAEAHAVLHVAADVARAVDYAALARVRVTRQQQHNDEAVRR